MIKGGYFVKWLVDVILNIIENCNNSLEKFIDLFEQMQAIEFIENNVIFRALATIHFICGDVIYYTIVLILLYGTATVILQALLAIFRLVKEIKQTALF
mgnify:FL=1